MYSNPTEFGRRFSEWIKKQTSIWWIKADLDWYTMDLSNINNNLLDITKAKDTKEEILDRWTKQDSSIWKSIKKSIFSK